MSPTTRIILPAHSAGRRVRRGNPAPVRSDQTTVAGKRKLTRTSAPAGHAGSRKKLIPALPSVASLVGIAAVAVAATGAASMGHSVPAAVNVGAQSLTGQANVLNGVSSIGISSNFENREKAVSRDSARQALADAAQADLKDAAEAQAEERNAALAALAASAEKHAAVIAANAWQLPLAPGSYRLTSRFGECSYLWSRCHTGLDFAAPTGTPVSSIANGVVTEVGSAGAYGNRVIVTLDDGTEVWYCHLNGYAVSTGDSVTGGEQVGYVGSTGNVTGPHLHLEVRPGAGDPVDPYTAMSVRGETP